MDVHVIDEESSLLGGTMQQHHQHHAAKKTKNKSKETILWRLITAAAFCAGIVASATVFALMAGRDRHLHNSAQVQVAGHADENAPVSTQRNDKDLDMSVFDLGQNWYAKSFLNKRHDTKKTTKFNDKKTKSSSSSSSSSTMPDDNTKKPKYKQFQALGFQLYTGGAPVEIPGQIGVLNPECLGRNSYGQAAELDPDDISANITNTLWQCYLGHENPAKDVAHRLEVMIDAVEKAHQVADPRSDTLKIFVAPEFFWRGLDGAYEFINASDTTSEEYRERVKIWKEADGDDYDPDCHEVCHILKGLEQLVAHKKYKDWLFLFGTVIVSESLPQEDDFDYVFYNFAPLYRGYDPDETDHYGKRFLVPKRYLSQIDFLTPARLFNESMTKQLIEYTGDEQLQDQTIVHNPFFEAPKRKFYDQEIWYWYKDELLALGYTMLEYDWLIMDDITFTVEICVDHYAQTALNTFMADIALGKPTLIPKSVETYDHKTKKYQGSVEYVRIPPHMAQLSLVSSSGMTIEPKALALADNGTIILQDGQTDRPSSMAWLSECGWFSWNFFGGSQHVTRTALLTTTEITFQYKIHPGWEQFGIWDDLDDEMDTTWKDRIKGVFTTTRYEPKITVYAPQDIAKV